MKWLGDFDGTLEDYITSLPAVTTIGAASATLTTTSYSVFDINRTAAHGEAGAETINALHIDFDRTVPTSGTHNHTDTGINLDTNAAGLGTSRTTGIDMDVVSATSGTSTATGIDVNVSGADTNYGIQVLCEGEQLRLSHNSADFASFIVADTGDLTITTVGDGATDSDLTLDIDGDITLDAAGENIVARSDQFNFSSVNANDPLVVIRNTTDCLLYTSDAADE